MRVNCKHNCSFVLITLFQLPIAQGFATFRPPPQKWSFRQSTPQLCFTNQKSIPAWTQHDLSSSLIDLEGWDEDDNNDNDETSSNSKQPDNLSQALPYESAQAQSRQRQRQRLQQMLQQEEKSKQSVERKLPLLVLQDENNSEELRKVDFPMPASHLPGEIANLNLYGTEVVSPVHVRLVKEVVGERDGEDEEENGYGRCYGHVVWLPRKEDIDDEDRDSLVGAVGVASEVVMCTPTSSLANPASASDSPAAKDDLGDDDTSEPLTVLVKGSFRFVVKSVESIFPYPVAVVEELIDEEIVESDEEEVEQNVNSQHTIDDEEDDDDDDDDDDDEEEDEGAIYQTMPSSELSARCVQAMRVLAKLRLEQSPNPPSSLLDAQQAMFGANLDSSSDNSNNPQAEMQMQMQESVKAEQFATMVELFLQELVEMVSWQSKTARRYAIGLMAAELAPLSHEEKVEMLKTTDGTERLRVLAQVLETEISMQRAKAMAEKLTSKTQAAQQQTSPTTTAVDQALQVGEPTLPPWAQSIRAGMRMEYYWNEEVGWCAGTIVESRKIVDEVVLTVEFDDGETHKVPLRGEEKARWRPPTDQ